MEHCQLTECKHSRTVIATEFPVGVPSWYLVVDKGHGMRLSEQIIKEKILVTNV